MDKFSSPAFFVEAVRRAVQDGNSIIVSGTGESMRSFIDPDTDRLVLSPLPSRLHMGDICLYVRENGHPVIHRIWQVRRDSYDMLGDAQMWIEYRVPAQRLVAVMSERIRGEERCYNRGKVRRRAVLRMLARQYCPKTRKFIRRIYGKVKTCLSKAQ